MSVRQTAPEHDLAREMLQDVRVRKFTILWLPRLREALLHWSGRILAFTAIIGANLGLARTSSMRSASVTELPIR